MWKRESKLTKEAVAWLSRAEGPFQAEIYERLMTPGFSTDQFLPSEVGALTDRQLDPCGYLVSWVKLIIAMPFRMPK